MSARPPGPLRPYGTGQSVTMDLTRWLLNGDRDEDCDRPAGAPASVSVVAAKMALQSFALPRGLGRPRAVEPDAG